MKEENPTDTNEPVSGEQTATSTVEHEWSESVPPALAVVEAIAAASNRHQLHLSPLHEYVDADALNTLVTSGTTGTDDSVQVAFPYEEYLVLVESDGTIEVRLDTALAE